MTKAKTRRKFNIFLKKKDKTRRNKKHYKGGDYGKEKIFYVFENPLKKDKTCENKKDEKCKDYDTEYLHKFIVNQYNKISFGSFKEILNSIDEKLALIKKGRTSEFIDPLVDGRKYNLEVNNFQNENDVFSPVAAPPIK